MRRLVLVPVVACLLAVAAHTIVNASGGSGGGGGTTITTSLKLGADAANNTSAANDFSLIGSNVITGGTADQEGGDLTIASGASKGSAGSQIIFQIPTPGGSGTTVRTAATVAALKYIAAIAGVGLEITGGLTTSAGAIIDGNAVVKTTIYARGGNAAATAIAFDQGASGAVSMAFQDNLAEALWLGEGANKYLTFETTNSKEGVVIGKALALSSQSTAAGTTSVEANIFYHGVTGTGGGTITLPQTEDVNAGHVLVIKDEGGNAGTNAITVDGAGAETIDGAANATINSNYGRITVTRRGSAWFRID